MALASIAFFFPHLIRMCLQFFFFFVVIVGLRFYSNIMMVQWMFDTGSGRLAIVFVWFL